MKMRRNEGKKKRKKWKDKMEGIEEEEGEKK